MTEDTNLADVTDGHPFHVPWAYHVFGVLSCLVCVKSTGTAWPGAQCAACCVCWYGALIHAAWPSGPQLGAASVGGRGI